MMRIIAAEDDHDVRFFVRSVLEAAGHQVFAAPNGIEALAILTEARTRGEARFDLLFTDILMPRMDGFELARQASALQPGLPVLYASGYSDKALADGRPVVAGRLLIKPFRSGTLLAEVARSQAPSSTPGTTVEMIDDHRPLSNGKD